MTVTFLVATDAGLVITRYERGSFIPEAHVLGGQDVTGVVYREGVVLAGTTEGVFRSDDWCATWAPVNAGLTIRHIRALAYDPDVSDREFAGTEPAGIFVSRDGALSWYNCDEVEKLRDGHGWFLPYSPAAGCVRDFAFNGSRAYAAVEVGGVLRSDDGGNQWRLAGGSTGEPSFDIPPAPMIFPDVHAVASHPASPDLVWAATAEGLYATVDGGDTWTVVHQGSYCRAVWIDPGDVKRIVLGPADSVARKNGRIEESRDGGATWASASAGLDLPWPNRMVEQLFGIDHYLFAVTNDGRAYMTQQQGLEWRPILSDISRVRGIAKFSGWE